MNVQRSLIRELMFYAFKLGHNETEKKQKNICRAKTEGKVDYSSVTRWFKKFCSACKNLDDQARSYRSKLLISRPRSKL